MSDYDAGRAVGYAEGYVEAQADAPKLTIINACICGVVSGGVRDARKGCPMHDPAAETQTGGTDRG